MTHPASPRAPAIIAPEEGRRYAMGTMHAVFKADGAVTQDAYSVSEWWLEPRTRGAPRHAHDEDHVYYVIEGTLSVLIEEAWQEAPTRSYILIPGGAPHSFENRGEQRAGFISFNAPGGFEPRVPAIAEALSQVDLRL